MLTIEQVDLFQAQLQTKMLEVALEQAKAELDDDTACAKKHRCMFRFLSLYFAVFTNPLYNYTMAETEATIAWISAVAGLNEVVPVSFTGYTIINSGSNSQQTISDIIGLQAALDNLQQQIDNIEDSEITIIDGGDAGFESGVTIIIRNDSTENWNNKDSKLLVGEMGFAIDDNVVTGIKIGVGESWKNTPYLFISFSPIVTDNGRNLDALNGGPPYNKQHNFQTEKEAWDYVLNPYAQAYITFPNEGIIADVEIGTIYFALGELPPPNDHDYNYTFNIHNAKSIFPEGLNPQGVASMRGYYVNNDFTTHFNLTNQNDTVVVQTHTDELWANRNDTGLYKVFSVHVKDKLKPTTIIVGTAYVRFRIRSIAFLWRENSSLLNEGLYSDAQLSELIRSLQGDKAGVAYTNMSDGGGSKVFNGGQEIVFDTRLVLPPTSDGNDGLYNIVVAAPLTAGIPNVHSPSTPNSPMVFHPVRTFKYTNGTIGESTNLQYGLYVVKKPITGSMPVKIV